MKTANIVLTALIINALFSAWIGMASNSSQSAGWTLWPVFARVEIIDAG